MAIRAEAGGERRCLPATASGVAAAAAALAFTCSAQAHSGPAGKDEASAHRDAHATARVLDRQRRAAWAQLTPAQRTGRVARIVRQTRRLNARLARERDDAGYWDPKLYPLPDFAINAVVLPTGKILMWGREPYVDGVRSNLGSARVFDPLTGAAKHVPPPPIAQNRDGDGDPMPAPIFCAGQTYLSDGRVLLAGGNLADPLPGRPYFSGLDYTFIFDPWSESWETGPRMTHGRWYPTLTRLPSGDVLIAGGADETGRALPDGNSRRNPYMDIWRVGENAPEPLKLLRPYPAGTRADPREFHKPLTPGGAFGLSPYPNMYVLPDGKVGLAGPGRQDSAILDTGPRLLDRHAAHGSAWTQVPGWPGNAPSVIHNGGTTAIEPELNALAGSWALLAMGGADPSADGEVKIAHRNVDRLDANPAARRWTHDVAGDLKRGRLYANTVLLPDGGTVILGGAVGSDHRKKRSPGLYYVGKPAPPAGLPIPDPPIDRRRVELRHPGERTWRLGAAQQEWRTYHSTAVLLPDGRIVSAGDDGNDKLIASRDDAEFYWPPYLFDASQCAPRPAIRSVGARAAPADRRAPWAVVAYGETFGIFSEHARAGMRPVLVAPAATTHAVDMNQRVVPLRVPSRVSGGGLNARAPASAAIAPPGWYMLFVVDADGTPSIARWVQVLPAAQARTARGGRALETVTRVRADPRARSCVNPDGSTFAERRLTAKLSVSRLTIRRGARRLDVRARITRRASGRVRIRLVSGGRRTSFGSTISGGRVRARRTISAPLAKLGTGIVTITYAGDGDTRAQSVRLRAAPRAARLRAQRPVLSAAGRLRARGTISRRAHGVVSVQLQFELAGRARAVELKARVRGGRWNISEKLSAVLLAQIAQRTATLHAYTLFTGDKRAAIRGEMRSHQVLGEP